MSCENALQLGIFAKRPVIRGEDPAEFEQLKKALLANLSPRGILEIFYVVEAAKGMWRLQRLEKAEAAIFDAAHSDFAGRQKSLSTHRLKRTMSQREVMEEWDKILKEINQEAKSDWDPRLEHALDAQAANTAPDAENGLIIAKAIVGTDEKSPLAEIARQRRATFREIERNLAAFYSLKDRRA